MLLFTIVYVLVYIVCAYNIIIKLMYINEYCIGGVFRSGKKVKILEWFEQTFKHVSGEDQLLQIDEFKRALHIKGVSLSSLNLQSLQAPKSCNFSNYEYLCDNITY